MADTPAPSKEEFAVLLNRLESAAAEYGQHQGGWEADRLVKARQAVVDAYSGHEPPADPNPLDPTNHYFRKCLKGHVAYSVSFPECPSCKIERERAAQPPRAQPYVAAAAGRVSNQVKLHNEDDQFTTDLRVLVAHAVGECDRCPDERQRGCKHCCWCSSSLTKAGE